ncbi:hypothetical protein BDV41DRAFT_538612 [Aspergillus transmontanensis]|uniref:Uncharacterized protein n=1 Tax=Aspergillus transmontanensis TaxID=1034304 RepID=A0A5N6VVT3_9EURO|nr:hypothetical protein BDV41DRAFT_538612 [Aspergillus transmontanensis]
MHLRYPTWSASFQYTLISILSGRAGMVLVTHFLHLFFILYSHTSPSSWQGFH